jgi:hypothetical protein
MLTLEQTGALFSGQNSSCPKAGQVDLTACITIPKRDVEGNYAAYKRRVAERLESPRSADHPKFMNERASLGKRKYISKRAW